MVSVSQSNLFHRRNSFIRTSVEKNLSLFYTLGECWRKELSPSFLRPCFMSSLKVSFSRSRLGTALSWASDYRLKLATSPWEGDRRRQECGGSGCNRRAMKTVEGRTEARAPQMLASAERPQSPGIPKVRKTLNSYRRKVSCCYILAA